MDGPISYNDVCLDFNRNEEALSNEQYSTNSISIVPNASSDHKEIYIVDQIEPVLLYNELSQENLDSNNFIRRIDENTHQPTIREDYITTEEQSYTYFDPNDLVQRLEQLGSRSKLSLSNEENETNHFLVDNNEQNSKLNIEHLTTLIDEIYQTNHIRKTSEDKYLLHQPLNIEQEHLSLIKDSAQNLPIRYQKHRTDKVSDLEIVKQGKGFKIGYIDRQGTDQRVILTKRIEAGPDIKNRDPHVRSSYKVRRQLNLTFSSVLYTNGNNTLQEDRRFQRSTENIDIPSIGTNPKHFDEVCLISFRTK